MLGEAQDGSMLVNHMSYSQYSHNIVSGGQGRTILNYQMDIYAQPG